MLVDRHDGRCRTCGGQLEITDADDATMSVECTACGDSYLVEPDAFGDGCMTYYVGFLSERYAGGEDVDE
jgi:DNA-directed RNA polymerase subunit RPC12/RpoP